MMLNLYGEEVALSVVIEIQGNAESCCRRTCTGIETDTRDAESVKYGPVQHAFLEESTVPKAPRKAKKSADRHLERSTSFRLGHSVLKAADVIAREESAARGVKVSRADIIREAIMERYRRRKVKRKR